jgi:stress response protein YsnF/iron-sulfur cluster repair protein YtfE (RIC family)
MSFRTMMLAGPTKANELFAKLSETSDGAVKTRERLFAELKAELELHTSLEEEHLFPILRRNAETKGLVADAVKDNRELRAKLAELDALPKTDEAFPERLKELQKAFRQHARDEKRELLPAVQQALSEEQVQAVAEKMEASLAEAEQAKQAEAEERRAKARQEREEAEFLARQAELRAERDQAAEASTRETARRVADAALAPVEAATEAVRHGTRLVTRAAEVAGDTDRQAPARTAPPSFADLFLWPWTGAVQILQQAGGVAAARGPSGLEEVIPLGEEVLEVNKRTESRGTARIRRYVVETPVEEQVTLQSERVVVERRRPVDDRVTGEILTEVAVEVIETAEVPVVEKRARLREEIVVRTERTQQVKTVREMVRRDEVEIEQPGRKRGAQQLRSVAAER